MAKLYVLNVECDNREIAEAIQSWVGRNFNSEEVFWNAISEKD